MGYAAAQRKVRSARAGREPNHELTSPWTSLWGLIMTNPAKQNIITWIRGSRPGGRLQIGTPASFESESVVGFLLECVAGFVGTRNFGSDLGDGEHPIDSSAALVSPTPPDVDLGNEPVTTFDGRSRHCRERHWPLSAPISISTMLSQPCLGCSGTQAAWSTRRASIGKAA